jgi:hypothetical protein
MVTLWRQALNGMKLKSLHDEFDNDTVPTELRGGIFTG